MLKKLILYLFISTNLLCDTDYTLNSNLEYIDNRQVLFYKIMNNWNMYSSPTSEKLCHKLVKSESIGNLNLKYNSSKEELKFVFKNSFASFFTVFKQCKNCYGPTYLKNIYMNEKYFESSTTKDIHTELSEINELVFKNINKVTFNKFEKIENNLTLILEGYVGGLLSSNGTVSLHQVGKFFRSCPLKTEKDFPLHFKIINNNTKEVLLDYFIVWSNK